MHMLPAIVALSFTAVLARSHDHGPSDHDHDASHPHPRCLTDADIDYFVEAFNKVTLKAPCYETLIEEILREDFTTSSDSLSFLEHGKLNSTNAHSRTEYLQKYVEPIEDFFDPKTLFLSHSCDTFTWYREWYVTQEEEGKSRFPVREMAVLFVDLDTKDKKGEGKGAGGKKIFKAFYEFNVGAVLVEACSDGGGANQAKCTDLSKWGLGVGREGRRGCERQS